MSRIAIEVAAVLIQKSDRPPLAPQRNERIDGHLSFRRELVIGFERGVRNRSPRGASAYLDLYSVDMRALAVAVAGTLLCAPLAACGSSPSSPAAPAGPNAPAPAINVTGTWNGTGSDSFSPELVTWVLAQSGMTVTGTAELKPVDPTDGSCGSCHKVKKGTFNGTLAGNSLSVSMAFPAGGDLPTPICVAELSGTATVVDRRITASYTGTDTCEGIFSDGKIELTRQP